MVSGHFPLTIQYYMALTHRVERIQEQVREEVSQMLATEVRDPGALRPIVPVASFEPDFQRWWPFQVDPARDCQTGLVVRSP